MQFESHVEVWILAFQEYFMFHNSVSSFQGSGCKLRASPTMRGLGWAGMVDSEPVQPLPESHSKPNGHLAPP
eukprot:1504550-Rhodomonas_salina.1